MKTSFNFDMKDWIEFQKYGLLTNKSYKKWKYISLLMIPILLIILTILDYFKYGFLLGQKILFYLVVSIIWILFRYFFYDKLIIKKIKKILEKWNNSSLIWEHTISFEEDCFNISLPWSDSKVYWSKINKIEENEKYIFIFNSSLSAYIIPKFKLWDNSENIISFIRTKKT